MLTLCSSVRPLSLTFKVHWPNSLKSVRFRRIGELKSLGRLLELNPSCRDLLEHAGRPRTRIKYIPATTA